MTSPTMVDRRLTVIVCVHRTLTAAFNHGNTEGINYCRLLTELLHPLVHHRFPLSVIPAPFPHRGERRCFLESSPAHLCQRPNYTRHIRGSHYEDRLRAGNTFPESEVKCTELLTNSGAIHP
jgi:hypothetical protein